MMKQSIVIKRCTEADAPTLAALRKQTFFDTFHEQNSKEDMDIFLQQFSEEDVQRDIAEPSSIFMIAYDGEAPVGYAKLSERVRNTELVGENTIRLSSLYVLQSHKGKGIGKLLMEQCIWISKSKNKSLLWLGVWEHNHHAIEFYKRFGFEKFGDEVFMLGNDAQNDWLMKKALV